ncbi:hypothetical protein PPTG_10793 [Phytophthora nicotianae INRA-310]|uniref:Uncharacterized protein n=1 Tax=Phytophthora nicotianae (strain INRA-310) TaxID=761204 RepID=W2QCN2_PHYN3|nr:hypothetical protein PPTG_10793 [Phytophthora nicotianae INRA-310]ETN10040.1 hypothetical protein PPTG_10793 [Phytophthora nicotianae INRA-310]
MESEAKGKAGSTAVSVFVPLVAPMIESTSHAASVNGSEEKSKEHLQLVLAELAGGSVRPGVEIDKKDLTNELLLGKIDDILTTVKNNTVPTLRLSSRLQYG